MLESSVAAEIAIILCLFLDGECHLFYQQCNAKLIGRRVTEAMSDTSFRCKVVAVIVADFSDVMTPCHTSLSPLRLLC